MQRAETVLDVLRERGADRVSGIATGEPGDRKRSRRVREGGVGKGPSVLAPRRRPTSSVSALLEQMLGTESESGSTGR